MQPVPSDPIPETPERRAEITQAIRAATGLDDAVIEKLVREFHGAARQDPLLGPVFARVTDWEAHIRKICAFWSSVALLTGTYHGRPMPAHMPLGLEPAHFSRWLALFEETARTICSPAGADHLVMKANRIAQSLQLGIAVSKGQLPQRMPYPGASRS